LIFLVAFSTARRDAEKIHRSAIMPRWIETAGTFEAKIRQ